MNFVFTGPAQVGSVRLVRENLVKLAKDQGHSVLSSVSRKVDYVVASSADFKGRMGRKLRMADELGVECISPEEFVRMMGGRIELRLKDLA